MWITKRVDDKTHVTYGVGWLYALLAVMTLGYLAQNGTIVPALALAAVVWGLVKWDRRRKNRRTQSSASGSYGSSSSSSSSGSGSQYM